MGVYAHIRNNTVKASIKTTGLLVTLVAILASPLYSQVLAAVESPSPADTMFNNAIMITGYGSAAEPQIPALRELIASFNAEVERREYPGGELNNRRVGAVEEAIKSIEAAKDHPSLRSTTSASKR